MSKFLRAVKRHGGTKAVAELLDCTYEYVRAIGAGDKTPGLAMAFKIEEVMGIPVAYWNGRSTTVDDSGGKAAS